MKTLRRKVNQHLADLEAAKQRVKTEEAALTVAEQRATDIREATGIAQQVAQQIQQQAHDQIAGVVTRCLAAVFPDPYVFRILFERKRGRTEARLIFERDGLEVDPLTASGGGVVDVAAFALRLSCMMLSRPPLRRLLVLDEPFKWLSGDLRGNLRALLIQLTEELGVQIVMVTHVGEFQAGKVLELS